MVRHPDASPDVHVTRRRRPTPEGVPAHPVDLCDPEGVERLFVDVAPRVVVHTAYTTTSYDDIVTASRVVAEACARHGAELVHLSTESVFDGEHAPYAEDDEPTPVHDYGRWKAEAELAVAAALPEVCIVRPSLVVSLDPPDPGTARVLSAATGDDELVLFDDELRQPILADDLAGELWALTQLDAGARAGVWHLPGPQVLSRAELGRRLCARAGVEPGRLRSGRQQDHVRGPRPRDLTMLAVRREGLGRPPRRI